MWQILQRRLKHWLFRADYGRMRRAAAAGNYPLAADLAWLLGEHDLMRRYEALHRTRIILARTTVPSRDNPFARCALEHRLKERRN